MERVEESAVDEICGPDHGSGPNQEPPCQTGKSITSAERRDTEENLPGPAERLFVPDLLS